MNTEEYKTKYKTVDAAPGWDAIDDALKKLYSDQEPKHWAATPHYSIGGKDPIDGISYYEAYHEGELYYHFVTYGFSHLYYDEKYLDDEFSNFGFELTFRLKPYQLDDNGPTWVFQLIQNIARYVFKSGKWFEPYHYMPANGQIRTDSDTTLRGLVFLLDPELGEINTPHGKVQFLQLFGITDKELNTITESKSDAEELIKQHTIKNPLLITDIDRKYSEIHKENEVHNLIIDTILNKQTTIESSINDKDIKASKTDWKTKPIPFKKTELGYHQLFTNLEAETLLQGIIPKEMEDKWFVYFDDGWLYLHRSWTGHLIYWLKLDGSPSGMRITESWVNRDPDEYNSSDTDYDKEMLNYLLNTFMLSKEVPFPVKAKDSKNAEIFQHHITGTAYPHKIIKTSFWKRLRKLFKK